MEQQRLFLWLSFAFVLYLLYQAWVTDHAPAIAPGTAPSIANPAGDLPPVASSGDLPSAPPTAPGQSITNAPDISAPSTPVPSGKRITVRTDVMAVEIDTLGADLRQARLLRYPVSKDTPDVVVKLLDDSTNASLYVFQSGIRGANGGAEPTHQAQFTSAQDNYELGEGQDSLRVVLNWSEGDLQASKTYVFHRGKYAIEVTQSVTNGSADNWSGAPYIQLKRRDKKVSRSMTDVDSYSYTGPVLYDGTKYEKLKFKDLIKAPVDVVTANGWLGSIQHHFVGAAVPPTGTEMAYNVRVVDGEYYLMTAIATTATTVSPGTSHSFNHQLFVGPKLQSQLRDVAEKLDLSVDYGFFTVLAKPLFWVLEKIHGLTNNWGWAIIFLTMLIKLLFYPLQAKAGFSMAKMRKLQPRLKQLQERYKDDREGLSRAMMDLYKREGANPMAGCLPILVQMPVFLALYWVLIESVEMRQAPFALWLNDLSSRDPYYILPLFMGATMFVQQKLNPAPPDPIQAKVMSMLPIVFTVFFAFFPAGLVLYWSVNNLLTIMQQWRINRIVEAGDA